MPASARSIPAFVDCSPKWSHDGRHIAFLRATPDRLLQLCLVTPDLKRVDPLIQPELVNPDRPFAAGHDHYVSPDSLAWSPDDKSIAYERSEWFDFDHNDRLPGTGLWRLNVATGKSRPLAVHTHHYTGNLYYYRYPQWAADGRHIAFVGEGVNGQRAIFVRNTALQSSQVSPRYDKFADSDWPVWKPQEAGQKPPVLAYRQGIRRAPFTPATETLRLLSPGAADGSSAKELWRLRSAESSTGAPSVPRVGNLTWSPDGQQIAFSLTPDATDFTRAQIQICDMGGRTIRVSPADGFGYFAPVWIDMDRIGALRPLSDGRFDVVVLNRKTGLVTRCGSIESADCDWSPDRQSIVYAVPVSRLPSAGSSVLTLHLLRTGITVSLVARKFL